MTGYHHRQILYGCIIFLYLALTLGLQHQMIAPLHPTPTSQSLHSILGVQIHNQSALQLPLLRSGLRQQILANHPDKIRSQDVQVLKNSETKFKRAREAFEILQDTRKRQAYERFGNSILSNPRYDSCSSPDEFLFAAMEVKGVDLILTNLAIVWLFVGRSGVRYFQFQPRGKVLLMASYPLAIY
jgi:curved DNA-binding protein CbpA